jgi:hypothetical protein
MGRLRPLLPLSLAVTLLAVLATGAHAQYDPYEMRYGPTADVSVDDLIQMPESYLNKPVRTRGELEMYPGSTQLRYSLRGRFSGRILITPMPEAAWEFENNAKQWLGREVEVTGLFQAGRDSSGSGMVYMIAVYGFVGPPDEKAEKGKPVTEVTLEDLLTRPGKLDGKLVRVRGQFRGQNLFGDLPAASRKGSSDWVIKEDLFAAWVTGRKPKGSGWAFDAGLKRDTGKWLQVVGRVSTFRGVVTIEAQSVALVQEPAATANTAAASPSPQAPPAPPPRPRRPPVVVFSLPLDGERDVPPGTVFQVQFSKDMEEPSFKDRVVLRYAGRPQPGDRDLDAVKWSYDGGLRTLNVDPGDLLRPGRVVEILLLPGIVDLDGMPLETRPGARPGGVTDVLRFQIASGGLIGGVGR